MTPLKIRRHLLALAAFLLLSFIPTVAEVVKLMSDCDEFLLEKNVPQVPGILKDGKILADHFKPICQTFKNERRFLTLYDTQNKIPVFSAYKYRGGGGDEKRPTPPWKIEPQLDGETDKNMKTDDNKKREKQASDSDYIKLAKAKELNRGHLFPSSHALNDDDKVSTFTLTNIVPQAITFNGGSWNRMEQCVKCVMDKNCIDNNGEIEGFVVTGAKPSTKNFLNNRVNIPSMLWSAFCCYSKNTENWIGGAHWSNNVKDDPENEHLQTKTLAELENKTKLRVFHKNCLLASHLDDCKCPK